MKRMITSFNRVALVFVAILLIGLSACTAATSTITSTVTSITPVTTTIITPVTSTTTAVTTIPGAPTTQTVTTTELAIITNTMTTTETASNAVDFASAAAKVLPSVVTIEDQQKTTGVFGRQVTASEAGSGWIFNNSGIIVTNAHVVYNATDIQVTLVDGIVYPATVVQIDLNNDLAVIKISATGLKAASIGDSSKLVMGQLIATVGNSLDRGIRFTGGYISRLNASVSYSIGQTNVTFNDLIETDSVINPGNSGGVLIDTSGNVVGITNAALMGTTEVSGFGYAIPINRAIQVINSLIS
jgi:serine protease Do